MIVWISVAAATLSVVAMLATLWFARPSYLVWRAEIGDDLPSGKTLPADLDRVLFKRFWQWLSIVGGIIASITVAAWVLLSSSFGAIAQRTADEAAKDAVARLQTEVLRLKNETEIARANSLEAIRDSAEATGRINGAAANAEKTANAAERAANNAASLAVSAQSELSRILKTSELVQAQSRDFSNIEKIVAELASNPAFQETVISKALDPLKGIVVASTRSCPELGTGWTVFEEGAGRFIIGVGGKYELPYVAGEPKYQIGGAEERNIALTSMPEHRHTLPMHTTGEEAPHVRGGAATTDFFQHRVFVTGTTNHVTASTGGKVPHNNMPPYIALYFCKKEGG